MKVKYYVEYRGDEGRFYYPSLHGFSDKPSALEAAKKASKTLHARVVEKKWKIIKTFHPGNK